MYLVLPSRLTRWRPLSCAGSLAAMTILAAACSSERTSKGEKQASDSAFQAMQARGKVAMSVDQYSSSHQFEPLADGGRIELQTDTGDSSEVAAIRTHLLGITQSFKAGDFATPTFVHAGDVPGADVMRARNKSITYTFGALPRGGEVRISTLDSAALTAIHRFLAFQRAEHHTGHTGVNP